LNLQREQTLIKTRRKILIRRRLSVLIVRSLVILPLNAGHFAYESKQRMTKSWLKLRHSLVDGDNNQQ